ncbi:hypothetical protein XENORESO_012513 [Xenotaenia resolanae]|uniref:ArfGAP with FG repeats 1a n=1 Tax=Xenotaenia resolanae TaxID=208358 RepID=A0ABV0WS84_9TELE
MLCLNSFIHTSPLTFCCFFFLGLSSVHLNITSSAPPAAQKVSAGAGFANFDAFGSSPAPQASFQPPNTGGGIPGGMSSATAASAGVAGLPQKQPTGFTGGDRYAALAELDTVFSSSAPATSVYNTSSTSQGGVFGSETVSSAQAQQVMPGMPQGFGAAPSTNPFVAAGVAPAAPPTNPFQCNGRAASVAAAAGLFLRTCL